MALSRDETTHPGELLRVENEIKTSQAKFDNRLAILEHRRALKTVHQTVPEAPKHLSSKVKKTRESPAAEPEAMQLKVRSSWTVYIGILANVTMSYHICSVEPCTVN